MATAWREPSGQGRMIEVRCRDCGRLLFRAEERGGRIEIVCPDRRCKRYQTHQLTGRNQA